MSLPDTITNLGNAIINLTDGKVDAHCNSVESDLQNVKAIIDDLVDGDSSIEDIVVENTAEARSYATTAKRWAEGTDAQVQAMGGVHSAKKWSEVWDGRLSLEQSYFNNVAALREATGLQAGQVFTTKGYYSPNDGGGARYLIRVKASGDVDNSGSILFLADSNLVAELITENGVVNVKCFGAKGDGVSDDTVAIQTALNYTVNSSGEVYFPKSTYIIDNIELTLTENNTIKITGDGDSSRLQGKTDFVFTLVGSPYWNTPLLINNICFYGNSRTKSGILYNSSTAGRVTYNNCCFKELNFGIKKAKGNIGNVFNRCLFTKNNYGYYALPSTSPKMHSGCDTFEQCHFDCHFNAAVMIYNGISGAGGFTFNQCIFEANHSFGYFIVRGDNGDNLPSVNFNECWDEANADNASVSSKPIIEGFNLSSIDSNFTYNSETGNSEYVGPYYQTYVSGTTVQYDQKLLIKDAFVNGAKVEISTAIMNDYTVYSDDIKTRIPEHNIKVENLIVDKGNGNHFPFEIDTLLRVMRDNEATNRYASFIARKRYTNVNSDYYNLIENAKATHTNAGFYRAPKFKGEVIGESGYGIYFSQNVTNTAHSILNNSLDVPLNKYVVYLFSVRKNSECDDSSWLYLFTNNLPNGSWYNLFCFNAATTKANKVYRCKSLLLQGNTNETFMPAIQLRNLTTGVHSWEISDMAVVVFDKYEDALTFINSTNFPSSRLHNRRKVGDYYASSAPTSGTWCPNDIIYNAASTSGGNLGWIVPSDSYGTFGTLSGVTGSIENGSNQLTVSSDTALFEGQFISIAGVTTNPKKKIIRIDKANHILTLDTINSDSSVTSAAVAFVTPTLKTFGEIS